MEKEELVKYIENKLLLSFIIKGYLELKVYVGGENGEPKIVEEEAKYIRAIFNMYLDGKSLD